MHAFANDSCRGVGETIFAQKLHIIRSAFFAEFNINLLAFAGWQMVWYFLASETDTLTQLLK